MRHARILIVYGSQHGQAAKIARRIADCLAAADCDVTVLRGDELPRSLAVTSFDAVLVGGSTHVGRHQRYIERFVREHLQELLALPTGFFSVSGSAGSPRPAGRADAERMLQDFLRRTQWQPTLATTFAGAIAFTRYDPLTRWMMRRISRKEGAATDTSRDHEYTDWAAVTAFAHSLAALVARSAPQLAHAG
jgi:menaquinone-dependent protoporphyrinogen oxidase